MATRPERFALVVRSHRQASHVVFRIGRENATLLDLVVVALGTGWAVTVVGGGLGWWTTWWHSSSDFRLPVVLLAVGASIAGGVAAAYTFARLTAKAELDRTRRVRHIAASALAGGVLGLVQLVEAIITGEGPPATVTVTSRDDIRRVEADFRAQALTLLLHEPLAEAFAEHANQWWVVATTTPGLRDDIQLIEELLQGAQSLRSWPVTARNVIVQNGQPTALQAEKLRYFADIAWQMLRVCYDRAQVHLDPEL